MSGKPPTIRGLAIPLGAVSAFVSYIILSTALIYPTTDFMGLLGWMAAPLVMPLLAALSFRSQRVRRSASLVLAIVTFCGAVSLVWAWSVNSSEFNLIVLFLPFYQFAISAVLTVIFGLSAILKRSHISGDRVE